MNSLVCALPWLILRVHDNGRLTSNHAGDRSPKADAIDRLNPVAFVDDYLPDHRGVAPHIHKALIVCEPMGSPNVGPDLATIDSQHLDLRAFAASWPRIRR